MGLIYTLEEELVSGPTPSNSLIPPYHTRLHRPLTVQALLALDLGPWGWVLVSVSPLIPPYERDPRDGLL